MNLTNLVPKRQFGNYSFKEKDFEYPEPKPQRFHSKILSEKL